MIRLCVYTKKTLKSPTRKCLSTYLEVQDGLLNPMFSKGHQQLTAATVNKAGHVHPSIHFLPLISVWGKQSKQRLPLPSP